MKILVKIGGALLDEAASRQRLAAEIAALAQSGHAVAVVHGGGAQITRYLAARGIESTFVDGLRVTTPEVMDALLKVLAGTLNQELVAAFIAAGALAVGLSGVDALLARAEPMSPQLGLTGRTAGCDARLLHLLTENGYLPVIACLGGDRSGRIYNVNADQMAAACAASFAAEKIFFLTDVEGVRGAANETLAALTSGECAALIQNGVAGGGMRAKLGAACDALQRGVGEVLIAPGAQHGIIRKLMSGDAAGTRITMAAGALAT